MVLSNSGWRGLFALDGEEGVSGGISWAQRLLGAAMGLVWGEWLVRQQGRGTTVLAGTDSRPTGPLLAEMLMRGLEHSGCMVLYAGVVAAPEIMACSRQQGIGGFAYISASHNPLGHNGVKFGLNGGVLGGPEAGRLREELRRLIASKGAAARLEAIVAHVYPRSADGAQKSRCLSSYWQFLEDIAGGPGTEQECRDTLNALRRALKEYPVGILADLNGSARCCSADSDYLESLGLRFEAINALPGAVAHKIEPEGEALEPCRLALEAAHARDSSMLLGYVPDNDGDRGNLVIWDESIGGARILEAQEVFALAVLAELACAPRHSREAVVVNGPTSHRIREIAAHYNAEVFEAEVGEANVVNRAAELRAEGYRVRILGEGSNGGCITHPAAVRDPLNTITALLKLMRLPARSGIPAPFADWCRRTGQPEPAGGLPSPAALTASLPRYTTTPSSSARARISISTSDYAALKSAWEEIFARQWLARKNEWKQKFGFANWEEINNEGTVSRSGVAARTGRETGGLKVVFRDDGGSYRGFLWMRGSGTEAVFRVMAELRGNRPEGERELLEWMRDMVVSACKD
ncbi:MAG: hypothetical protein B0D92_05300 [Spirochaeta sp. LUC14_002_19_P3]|nr:MAG: hypothetical protein B0D92_05300 [Spirochaeta sp. LUC14_002_19_P3]